TIQVLPGLSVAHGSNGRKIRVKVPTCAQQSYFVEKSLSQHGIKAPRNAFVQSRPIGRKQGQLEHSPGEARRLAHALQLRQRTAGQFEHFEGPLQSLRVVGS